VDVEFARRLHDGDVVGWSQELDAKACKLTHVPSHSPPAAERRATQGRDTPQLVV